MSLIASSHGQLFVFTPTSHKNCAFTISYKSDSFRYPKLGFNHDALFPRINNHYDEPAIAIIDMQINLALRVSEATKFYTPSKTKAT